MDDIETAEVLALCAGFDQRKVGDADVDAWTLALPDVQRDHAMRAVVEFYRTHAERRITPADILRLSREIRAQDAARLRSAQLADRREADRRSLPAPAPTTDRRATIRELIERHRTWDVDGDLHVRRKQARWHPDLEQAYRQARVHAAHTTAAAAQDHPAGPTPDVDEGLTHGDA